MLTLNTVTEKLLNSINHSWLDFLSSPGSPFVIPTKMSSFLKIVFSSLWSFTIDWVNARGFLSE